MKWTSVPLLAVLLLVSIINSPPFSSASEAPDPVLDTAGKKLRAGALYYIWPVYPTGGLLLDHPENKTCPLEIVQASTNQPYPGIPVSFSPIYPKKGVVRVSTDLNILFDKAYTPCPESHWWRVDVYDPSTGNYFLTTGGVQGNPGPKTIRNWFKIEKFGPAGEYKLVYCPTFCSYCKVMCRDVGVFAENGKRRLALRDAPLKVVFKEV